jgi:hypothetical protein
MADTSFTTYNSVLSHYPFLSGRSLGPQETADMPNLQSLRMQTAARRMTDNNLENARICQFEVPGGGECRNPACEDMHLSQLQVEPNGARRPVTLLIFAMSSSYRLGGGLVWGMVDLFADEETAEYLCGDRNVVQMVQAVQAARTRRPEATFDERVKEAWANMRGLWTQVTFDDKT